MTESTRTYIHWDENGQNQAKLRQKQLGKKVGGKRRYMKRRYGKKLTKNNYFGMATKSITKYRNIGKLMPSVDYNGEVLTDYGNGKVAFYFSEIKEVNRLMKLYKDIKITKVKLHVY